MSLVDFEYREHQGVLSDADIDMVVGLDALIFGNGWAAKIRERLRTEPTLFTQLVFSDAKLIAMKAGYQKSPDTFGSWIGGVHPDFRGRGIAKDLMRRQHAWCKNRGYKTVTTTSQNKFKSMLILNLKEGFDIVGTETGTDGILRIRFAKVLRS